MTGTLELGSTRLERRGDEWFVLCPTELLGEAADWWISVETAFVGALDVGPAPFLSVATLLAARHGLDIEITEPIDDVHVANCRAAATIMHEWWGWRVPQIRYVASAADQSAIERDFDESRPAESLTGLLFTRGVDSTSVLLQGLDGEGPRADLLIFVDGIEPVYSPLTRAQNWRDIVSVADSVGLPVARLHTNLRSIAERWVRWEDAHGAVLIGTALVLGRALSELLIAPTNPVTVSVPFGSSPALDRLWSTARTTVVATDPHGSRIDRLRRIVRHPELLPTLKLCWESDQRGNCGRCRKCLLAATAFVVIDAADLIPLVFDSPLSVSAVRGLRAHPSVITGEVLAALRASTPQPGAEAFVEALCDAWQEVIDRLAESRTPTSADKPNHVLRSFDAHELCMMDPGLDRPNRWCLIDTYSEGHCRLAWELSTHWGPGLVSLAVGLPAAPPPAVAHRLRQTAVTRCWWSDGDSLDADRMHEALRAGCVPVQVMSPDRADHVRRGLPTSTRGLVLGLDELESGWPADADLALLWFAAVRVALVQTPAHGDTGVHA